ncbi:hypothetical protein [Pontibacter liquoris]|uniref:hypothetical protein n=1 Tax=Pontibacter liquoris TaxID=2905677 RepID=UPI001FA77DE4|nr:hypothetical protein [Pontibacter liquoris]
MHYDENEPRHPRYREQPPQRQREQPPHYEEDHFNDFRSRWGDPAPLFSRNRNEWHEQSHPPGEGRLNRHEEWQHSQPRQAGRDWQQEYSDRPRPWQQQDEYFHNSNQHANDRWQYDHAMPYPTYRHERQLPPDEYWDDRLR